MYNHLASMDDLGTEHHTLPRISPFGDIVNNIETSETNGTRVHVLGIPRDRTLRSCEMYAKVEGMMPVDSSRKSMSAENYQVGKLPSFGAWLRGTRERLGIDLETMSLRSGVDRSSINRIEREVSQPTLCTAVRLCEALGVGPHELVWSLQGRSLPQIAQENAVGDMPALKLSDLDLFVRLTRHDIDAARSILVGWLNELSTLYYEDRNHAAATTDDDSQNSSNLPYFTESDVDKVLNDLAFYKSELQYPPQDNGSIIFDTYRRGGALTLKDVGAYIRWLRLERGTSLAGIGEQDGPSSSALSRIETGQLENVRLKDILLLDDVLSREGEILRMSWEACALSPNGTRIRNRNKSDQQSSKAWSERELKLAVAVVTIGRWWSYFLPHDETLIKRMRSDMDNCFASESARTQ